MLEEAINNQLKHLRPWLKEKKIEAYRLLDRTDPKYPVTIDVYGDYFHVYVYESKHFSSGELKKETWNALKSIFPKLNSDHLIFKIRKQQKDGSQYEKLQEKKERVIVKEGKSRYLINLTDYLDTGLFLDHRKTREVFSKLVRGSRRVLNLFSYTGAFSITAFYSGVEYTTSVDMSNQYCAWAKDNFDLNNMDPFKHIVIRDNVFFFFENIKSKNWKFDFIVIDPPTVSRSKKMLRKFDIQRDHPLLINSSLDLLNPGGTILFSNNFRKFKLNHQAIA